MKGIVVYKTRYGSAKKYAEWLAEATGYGCVSVDQADVTELTACDTIVFCGSVYASGISCAHYLRKVYPKIRDKRILVFTCAASPYDEKFFNELVRTNMKDDLSGIPVFYGRGAFNMRTMNFRDRTLCKMLRKAISKKDPKDYELWESALMEVGEDEAGDWTDKSYLEPVIGYLNS